jgi:hypothetical protein
MTGAEFQHSQLEPQQQLLIAGKIARLYDADRDTFDSTTHPYDAQEIVRALNPLIGLTDNVNVITTKPPGRKGLTRFVGSTNQGNATVNIPGQEEGVRETKGRDEYRIGSHIVTKSIFIGRQDFNIMVIESYFDHGVINAVFENFPPRIKIFYIPDGLNVALIGRDDIESISVNNGWFGRVRNITPNYKFSILWPNKPSDPGVLP